jgi:NAD(P)-dependent dehydrogenase (short-subunit alcohol dehydrogenase family)
MGLLDGKAIVVTGAGRGIGREVALAAGAAGAQVVVADYGVALDGGEATSELAAEVAAEIASAGGEAVGVGDSVTTKEGAERIVNTTIERFGRIDGALTAAGIQRPGPFLEMSEEDWDGVIATHLRGQFTVLQAAAKAIVAQGGGGSLVAMGSGYLSGAPHLANYRAAKAGVLALAMTAAAELEELGVRVNTLAPAANTRMTDGFGVKVKGEAADVAPLALYLLSDLSKDVTGQIFSIAGGRIAGWSDPFENKVVLKDGRWTVEELAGHVPGLVAKHPSDGEGVLLSAPIN